jgi:hypothetical protein
MIGGKKVHKSHCVIFRHSEVAQILKPTYLYGGMSLTQQIYEAVYNAEITASEIPQLIQNMRLFVMHVETELALIDPLEFNERMAALAEIRNNYGTHIMGGEETLEQIQTSLNGLQELCTGRFQIVASVAQMPISKMLKTDVTGGLVKGGGEEAIYHETLESLQSKAHPFLDRHYQLLTKSAFGEDFELDVIWSKLDAMTEQEASAVQATKAQTDQVLVMCGAIDGGDVRARISADPDSGYNGLDENDLPDGEPEEEIRTQSGDERVKQAVTDAIINLETALDKKIHAATATSPLNNKPTPTQKQAEAGEYDKGRVKIAGLNILIENPYGSIRKGTDANGKKWRVELKDNYGEIAKTEGADGDGVDVFIRPHMTQAEANAINWVYVVDQINPVTGEFDEHKAMLGYDVTSEISAREAYLANYSPGWKGLGVITLASINAFKGWLEDGDLSKPFSNGFRANITDADGEHWITLNGGESAETGEKHGVHVKLDSEGRIIAGAGGKLDGKKLDRVKGEPKPGQPKEQVHGDSVEQTEQAKDHNISFDEYKAKNPELRESRAMKRWANDLSDAFEDGKYVETAHFDKIRQEIPAFLPDELKQDKDLLSELSAKINGQIEHDLTMLDLDHKKEVANYKRNVTKSRLGVVEADDKFGGKLKEIQEKINKLKDEKHRREHLGELDGDYAKEIIRKYKDKKKQEREAKANAAQAIESLVSSISSDVEHSADTQAATKTPYHPAVNSLANDLVEGGGSSYTYDEHGRITGRTPSLNPDWYRDNAFVVFKSNGELLSKAPSVKEIKQAAADHEAGKKLTSKQERIMTALSDVAKSEEEFHNAGFSGETLETARYLSDGFISGAIDDDYLGYAETADDFDDMFNNYSTLSGNAAESFLDDFFGESKDDDINGRGKSGDIEGAEKSERKESNNLTEQQNEPILTPTSQSEKANEGNDMNNNSKSEQSTGFKIPEDANYPAPAPREKLPAAPDEDELYSTVMKGGWVSVGSDIKTENNELPERETKSKRQEVLENSLAKKQAELDRRFNDHFDFAASTNGQPLNDKGKKGQAALNKMDKQNDAIRNQLSEVERTKQAIEREESKHKLSQLALGGMPSIVQSMVEGGELKQWRKFPDHFFVDGVDKGRIIIKNGVAMHKYLRDVPKDQYPKFRDAFNKINKSLREQDDQ